MRKIIPFLAIALMACDNKETKLQRFLLQGNEQAAKQNYPDAKRYYTQALKVDSCFADAWNNLGTIFFKEGNFAEALSSYDRALECQPDLYDAYLNRSNTYYELNNAAFALRDLQTFDDHRPDTSVSFFSRGLIHTKMRNYDDAIAAFRKALQMDPGNVEILVNMGTVYYYKKEYDSAKTILHQSFQVKADEPNAFNTLSLIETELGNDAVAFQWVNKALAIAPNNAYFLNNRGFLFLRQNDLPKAAADIDRSISEDPYNAWAYRNKGIYHLRMKDADAAVRLLERARSMDANIDKVNGYLGDAYLLKGDKERACSFYKESLAKNEIPEAQYLRLCR
jgi:tetratricopeptide (TPR) repeat protein